jgi:hypothetical protein
MRRILNGCDPAGKQQQHLGGAQVEVWSEDERAIPQYKSQFKVALK